MSIDVGAVSANMQEVMRLASIQEQRRRSGSTSMTIASTLATIGRTDQDR